MQGIAVKIGYLCTNCQVKQLQESEATHQCPSACWHGLLGQEQTKAVSPVSLFVDAISLHCTINLEQLLNDFYMHMLLIRILVVMYACAHVHDSSLNGACIDWSCPSRCNPALHDSSMPSGSSCKHAQY